MIKKDLILVSIIGVAVGLLSQPMLSTLIQGIGIGVRLGIFFGFIMLAPLALFAGYMLGRWIPVIYQFVKFAAVGSLNSFIDFGFLNLAILISSKNSGLAFTIFKAISFLIATTNSFFWNKYWTFGSKERATLAQTLSFYGIALVGVGLDVAFASGFVNGIARPTSISGNLWANIGVLVGIGASFLWNFVGYKFIVFKKQVSVVS